MTPNREWGQRGCWRPSKRGSKHVLGPAEGRTRGGKWYSLIDKIYPEAALRAAFTQVAANRGAAGVDHVTTATFASDLDANPGLRRGRLWRA